MALSSAFQERLEHMEQTRNQRLSLLQAEKELQINKSKTLASKLSDIRSVRQRCFKLDHKIAAQKFIISSLQFQLDRLDSIYLDQLQQFRALKCEVEDLEELEKEKDEYFASVTRDMGEFRDRAKKFSDECRIRVEELRNCLKELNSSYLQLKDNSGYSNNPDLTAAEMKKAELQAMKENLDISLASNYEIRAQLQKQLKSVLMSQHEEKRNL